MAMAAPTADGKAGRWTQENMLSSEMVTPKYEDAIVVKQCWLGVQRKEKRDRSIS